MVRVFAAPVDLRCSNFDVSRLRDISYQCGKELTCFFENVRADNETQFIYSSDRHVLSYKCVGFVNSSMYQLPIDLFKRFHNAEILYAANLGLKFVSRTLFDTANKLVDIHLEGNNLTGKLCLSIWHLTVEWKWWWDLVSINYNLTQTQFYSIAWLVFFRSMNCIRKIL